MTALPKGQYVKHYRYGFGIVIESDDEGTSIEFEVHGPKNFVTRLMDVELSDYTPPECFRAKWVKTAPVVRPTSRNTGIGKSATALRASAARANKR